MKKVIIIGASGSLAPYVIEALQTQNELKLTLFLRKKARLKQSKIQNCNIVEGDVMDYDVLKNAINGQDIVYVNLAGDLEAMTKNIVKAMKETGVKRVIAISSIGIYETPLRTVLIPYKKLADVFENSDLDYTIIRPSWFTSVNEIDYQITYKGEPEKGSVISRKSIADIISKIIENPTLYTRINICIYKPEI